MVDGQVPYRDFPVEYPPAALPVFLLPALGDRDYRSGFEGLMAGLGVALVLLVVAAEHRRPRSSSPSRRCSSARSC